MKCITEKIKVSGSADYAKVSWYLLDYSEDIGIEKRPIIIICPGGGYSFTADREAEMFALQWCAAGYHAAVIRYSVAPEARFPVAMHEVASVVLKARTMAEEWYIDTERIILEGSSAGGHLVCCYAQRWDKKLLGELTGECADRLKVNGLILNYPVISSGPYGHKESFEMLLGDKYDELKDDLSLEKTVDSAMPPTFVWTTNEDGLVPAENSLMLALEMRKQGLPVELHMYAKGDHGLGLADVRTITSEGGNIVPSVATWMELARIWMETVIIDGR